MSNTTQVFTSLAERVWNAIATEDDSAISRVRRYPWAEQVDLDRIDWGYVSGIAYGIARAEDAFESLESVAVRAHDAALTVYARWCGPDDAAFTAWQAEKH